MSDLFRTHLGEAPLSEEEKLALIPSLSTQRELNEFERANIIAARIWASAPRRLAATDQLTVGYQLALHQRMFNRTWRWAGRCRASEKNLGVPPVRIMQDLGILLGDARFWLQHQTYGADEIALRFHHRLVAIHPFVNGNGRHARLSADLLVRQLGGPLFSWGAGTGTDETVRAAYLAALRAADDLDCAPLLAFGRSGTI